MKTIEEYFIDWEQHVFGYGYGTGEEHTLGTLKDFMDHCHANTVASAVAPKYNYEELELALGPCVAWLMINILCNCNIIDYGTSPRFGWLSKEGAELKKFIDSKSKEELEKICCESDEDYVACFPDYCNCEGEKCSNPFWRSV